MPPPAPKPPSCPEGWPGKTPGQIRAAIGRAVVKADPDAARRRREEAEKDPRVELWREDAGTAAICGYGLPPDAALAADQAITTAALDLKAAGVAGTMDQLRARAYLDALLGQDSRPTPASTEPASTEPAGTETASTEPASTETASTETASTEAPGAEAASPEPARAGAAGAETASPETPGPARASPEASGAEPAGTAATGTEAASAGPGAGSPGPDGPGGDGPDGGNGRAGDAAGGNTPAAPSGIWSTSGTAHAPTRPACGTPGAATSNMPCPHSGCPIHLELRARGALTCGSQVSSDQAPGLWSDLPCGFGGHPRSACPRCRHRPMQGIGHGHIPGCRRNSLGLVGD